MLSSFFAVVSGVVHEGEVVNHASGVPLSGRRATAEEVRCRMIDAAVQQVTASGLTIAMTRLSMSETIRAAGVPRASAYRVWATKDDFVLDVLERLARESAQSVAPAVTLELCMTVVAENQELLETSGGRRTVLVSLVKEAVHESLRASVASERWKQYVALSMSVTNDIPEGNRKGLSAALGSAPRRLSRDLATFHRAFTELLGYRMKGAYEGNWELYAMLCSSSIDGLGLRALATSDNLQDAHKWPESCGKGGTAAAVAQLALFDAFMEPNPHFKASAAVQAVQACLVE